LSRKLKIERKDLPLIILMDEGYSSEIKKLEEKPDCDLMLQKSAISGFNSLRLLKEAQKIFR